VIRSRAVILQHHGASRSIQDPGCEGVGTAIELDFEPGDQEGNVDFTDGLALFKLDPVLGTGQDTLRCSDGRKDRGHFRGAVVHMVGKSEMSRDRHAGSLNLMNKMIGVAKSGADHDPLPCQLARFDRSIEPPQVVAIDG
jgi:hypothetical protein